MGWSHSRTLLGCTAASAKIDQISAQIAHIGRSAGAIDLDDEAAHGVDAVA
jgi:hypothetical protein